MKRRSRILILTLAFVLMLPQLAGAVNDGTNSVYTYNFDYWGEMMESPDAYRVEETVTSASLGLEVPMNAPQSLYVDGETLYVVDRGNNRILELARKDGRFSLVRIIDRVRGAEPETFNYPNDIAADQDGNLYVADTNNNRVVVMDRDLNYLKSFVKPTDTTFDQSSDFLPNKLVVDSAGRVFINATNVNKGLVKYEADGTFAGFIGANKVTYNLWDYIWKNFLSTKEQRAQQAAFVPTEYKNIYIDRDGFIYATNINFNESELLGDAAHPIRRLNSLGNDILIKNDRYPPIGDLDWVEQSTDHGPSKFYDVTVLENDMYVAIDRTRGRLFGYDPQGIMLWAFGMSGVSSDGSFNKAVSIEHMGYDLLVLDELDCSVTVFTPTEYGNLIYKASEEYLDGDYDGSAATWQEVMKYNPNYTLAIIGIGRSEMREAADLATTQERSAKYSDAMEHFKNAHDRENYGRAFRYYRKEWVEQNIGWIVLVLAVLLLIPVIKRTIEKIKWEVAAYESRQVRK